MRFLPALFALLLGACAAAGGEVPEAKERPARVMSMNVCTDQLVLALLEPERIASVSWIARDPAQSLMAAKAQALPVNHGFAEEVIAQRPDLVIAGALTTPVLRAMLERLGYPLLEVAHASTFAEIRRNTRQIAAALGEKARGEALIARMDRQLAQLARDPAPPLRVIAWDRSGFSAGEGTLYDAILEAAGANNLARGAMALSYRRPDIEVLLEAAPDLLVQGASDARAASLGDDVTRHPLVRRYWADRTLFIPQAAYVCGTPFVGDAALALREDLRAAAQRSGPALPFGRRAR